MAITKHVQHPKSSATTATTEGRTVPRLPSSGDLLYGEIAVNYRLGYETLSIRNSSNDIVPFTTNNHLITASPNSDSALIQGQIGIDMNEVEGFYIYNAARSGWQPLSTNHVDGESNLSEIPVVQDPQFACVSDTGLLYGSQYDSSTSSQTWSALATLNPDSKRLADSQEPKVIIDYFTTDMAQLTANILVFDVDAKKLKQYGKMVYTGGTAGPELLYTYDPSKNLIYYNKATQSAYRWTGTQMSPILESPTISTDSTMTATTVHNTVTISSNVFSADSSTHAVVYKMTPTNSANTHSNANYSLICGAKNTVNGSSGATTFGFNNTIASGANYSFVEGYGNTVSGEMAHAEGNLTQANGVASHAEGQSTSAIGQYSHAEGINTYANGMGSHSEGTANLNYMELYESDDSNYDVLLFEWGDPSDLVDKTIFVDNYIFVVSATAYDSSTDIGYIKVKENNNVLQTVVSGHSIDTGESIEGYFFEGNGPITNGIASHAEGIATSAIGQSSHAEGSATVANAGYSHAEGDTTSAIGQSSHAEGYLTKANGNYSHAEGSSTSANGNSSHAEGSSTSAIGHSSHAEGRSTSATNGYSHSEGLSTVASGSASHAEGYQTKANGNYSHAEGSGTTASSSGSHAEGGATVASGLYSHAEGNSTSANGSSSHAEGSSTSAIGQSSHAEGRATSAIGQSSHAEGWSTKASGSHSHAEGRATSAIGQSSHAEGSGTSASGDSSHAGGIGSVANGAASFAAGSGTVTNNDAEFACGRYNNSLTGKAGTTLFTVGNGRSTSARQNALEVRGDGKIYFIGSGSSRCLQDILERLGGY